MKKYNGLLRLLAVVFTMTSLLFGTLRAQTWSAFNDCARYTPVVILLPIHNPEQPQDC